RATTISKQPKNKVYEFCNMIGMNAIFYNPRNHLDVQVTEINCPDLANAFHINLTGTESTLSFDHWMGPTIKISLPSFSGRTQYNPDLLRYACQIECRVRAMQPLKVSRATLISNDDNEQHLEDYKNDTQNFSTSVMLSKPILALKFSQMKMQVEAPIVL
ncbi:Protein NEOXANTHIN-DEFICIENT 1, partial [Mucuna pruriens]